MIKIDTYRRIDLPSASIHSQQQYSQSEAVEIVQAQPQNSVFAIPRVIALPWRGNLRMSFLLPKVVENLHLLSFCFDRLPL
jgi:hypothetical protein